MSVTIIGGGATAMAAAAYFRIQNIPTKVYVRNERKRALWSSVPVKATGVAETSFYVPVSDSLHDAMNFSSMILVFTKTGDYENVIEEMIPHLREGQHILFMNGCWGLVKMIRRLLKEKEAPNVYIGETANMPFIASLQDDGRNVYFKAKKESIVYSSLGGEEKFSEILHHMAPKVSRVQSPVVTSLSATNPIIHTVGMLFNMSRVENGEDFYFFGNPLTEKVAAYMEGCDKERIAIAKALGVDIPSLLTVLQSFWGKRVDSLHEALTTNPSYKEVKGPTSLSHRYLEEDLSCGMAALYDLAQMMHVEAPYISRLVEILSLYLQKEYKPFLTLQDLRIVKQWKRS